MDLPHDTLTGGSIDRWILDQRISSDGLVDVYAGHARSDHSPVTIGVLPQFRTGQTAFRSRFLRECQRAAEATADNLAGYLGCGIAFDRLWYATVGDGHQSLAQRLEGGWQPDGGQLMSLAVQLMRGVCAISLAGLTHRAIHPRQLLVDPAGNLLVTGIGLAPDPSGEEAKSIGNEVAVPPECMAPEQITGAPFDVRGDLYAVACTIYWLGCGRPPFLGDSRGSVIAQHLEAEVAPPRRFSSRCPADLSAFLVGLLAKRPGDRTPASAPEVLHELEQMRQCHSQGFSTRRVLRDPKAAAAGSGEARSTMRRDGPAVPAGLRRWRMPIVVAMALACAVVAVIAAWPAGPTTPSVLAVQPVAPAPAPVVAPAVQPPAVVVLPPPPPDPSSVLAVAPGPVDPPLDPAKVAQIIERGEHLGPVQDLRKLLGEPDISADGGRRLWYGDFEFVVEDGYVLSGRRNAHGGASQARSGSP